MNSRTILGGTLAVAMVCVSCGSESSDGDSNDVIRIGMMLDPEAAGADALIAVREINAAGGINIDGVDRQIELVRITHQETPESAVEAVEQFVEQGVVAMVGPPWSSLTLGDKADYSDGAAAAAFAAKLLMVSGSATSAAITDLDDDDLMWRTIPSDNFQSSAGAAFAYEKRGARRAAVLHRDEPWGQGLSKQFGAAFEAAGGQMLNIAAYDPEQDVSSYGYPELDKVFEGMPDLIYLATFEEISQISTRIVQGGYLDAYGDSPPLFMGTDGVYFTDTLTNCAPEVLENTIGTSPAPDREDAGFKHFLDAYVEQGFGNGDDAWPYDYDAVYAIALAIQAAGSTDSSEFKKQMRAISRDDGGDSVIRPGQWAKARTALLAGEGIDFQGASGPLDFTEQGDPGIARYVLWSAVPGGSDGFEFDNSQAVVFGE